MSSGQGVCVYKDADNVMQYQGTSTSVQPQQREQQGSAGSVVGASRAEVVLSDARIDDGAALCVEQPSSLNLSISRPVLSASAGAEPPPAPGVSLPTGAVVQEAQRPLARKIFEFWAPELQHCSAESLAIASRAAPAPLASAAARAAWSSALAHHPDQARVGWFLRHLATGFMLGSSRAGRPRRRTSPGANARSAQAQRGVVDDWLHRELSAGRVVGPFASCPFGEQAFVSPLGVVAKSVPVGAPPKYRTTMDFTSSGVNDTINESTAAISYIANRDIAATWAPLRGSDVYAFVVDAQEAYRQVPISPSEYHKAVFTWGNEWFCDTRLAFGVSSGCVLYDTVASLLQWVVTSTTGHDVFRLLDDSAFWAIGEAAARALQQRVVSIYTSLGVPVQVDKLLAPAHAFKFLGFWWDLRAGLVSLPQQKWDKLVAFLATTKGRRALRLEEIERLCGLAQWATFVVYHGRAHLRALYDLERGVAGRGRERAMCWRRVGAEARLDLAWWDRVCTTSPPAPVLAQPPSSGVPPGDDAQHARHSIPLEWYLPRAPDVVVTTDAADVAGFGGWWQHRWFCGPYPAEMRLATEGSSTAFLELAAVLVAARLWGASWAGCRVHVYCDNKAAIDAWNRRSSPARRLMTVIRALADVLLGFNVGPFDLCWLSSDNNWMADELSRCSHAQATSASTLPPLLSPRLLAQGLTPDGYSPAPTSVLSDLLA